MSSKHDLEVSVKALAAYDEEDYAAALELFKSITATSKILFNMARLFADLGQHVEAVSLFEAAIAKDAYMAVAFFQCGVSYYHLRNMDAAMRSFNEALFHLRGNKSIDYEQLGLRYKLYACEVLFNRGLCYFQLNQDRDGMQDLQFALQEKQTPAHDIVDEAIRDQGEGYTLFSVPTGTLYRPLDQKVRNLAVRNYLGKARLVAATDESDNYTGFRAFEEMQKQQRELEPVQQGYASANLVRQSLRQGSVSSRSGSLSGSTRSEPLLRRAMPRPGLQRLRSQSVSQPPTVPRKDMSPPLPRKESAPVISHRQTPPVRPARPGLPGSSIVSSSRQRASTAELDLEKPEWSRKLNRHLPPTPPPDRPYTGTVPHRSASTSSASSAASLASRKQSSVASSSRLPIHIRSASLDCEPASVHPYLSLVADYEEPSGDAYFGDAYDLTQPRVSQHDISPRKMASIQSGTHTSSATPIQLRILHAQDDDAQDVARIVRLTFGQLLAMPLNQLMDKVEAKTRLPVKKLCIREAQPIGEGNLVMLCDEEDLQHTVEEALQQMRASQGTCARLTLYAR